MRSLLLREEYEITIWTASCGNRSRSSCGISICRTLSQSLNVSEILSSLPQQGLSDVAGKWLPQIIRDGMSGVPDAVVELMLDNPRCLLQLQNEILNSQSAHWHRPDTPKLSVRRRRKAKRLISRRLAFAVGVCASVGLIAHVVSREPALRTWWKMASPTDVARLPRREFYAALAQGVTTYRDSFINNARSEQRLIDCLARFKSDCEDLAGWETSNLDETEFEQLRILCVAWADKTVEVAAAVVESTDTFPRKRKIVADFLSGIARDFSEMSGASYDSV